MSALHFCRRCDLQAPLGCARVCTVADRYPAMAASQSTLLASGPLFRTVPRWVAAREAVRAVRAAAGCGAAAANGGAGSRAFCSRVSSVYNCKHARPTCRVIPLAPENQRTGLSQGLSCYAHKSVMDAASTASADSLAHDMHTVSSQWLIDVRRRACNAIAYCMPVPLAHRSTTWYSVARGTRPTTAN